MNNYTQVKRWLTAGYRAIFGRRGNGPNGIGSEGSECPRAFAPLYRSHSHSQRTSSALRRRLLNSSAHPSIV